MCPSGRVVRVGSNPLSGALVRCISSLACPLVVVFRVASSRRRRARILRLWPGVRVLSLRWRICLPVFAVLIGLWILKRGRLLSVLFDGLRWPRAGVPRRVPRLLCSAPSRLVGASDVWCGGLVRRHDAAVFGPGGGDRWRPCHRALWFRAFGCSRTLPPGGVPTGSGYPAGPASAGRTDASGAGRRRQPAAGAHLWLVGLVSPGCCMRSQFFSGAFTVSDFFFGAVVLGFW